jgi:diguanylate cyclase (GGDEF)-like protein
VFYDVSNIDEHGHLLAHYATHDALTGLTNRREFERRLTDLLASAKRKGEQHALCYIDLDQFKVVNDTCGHVVGDKLLRQLTYLLQQHVRDSDTLARLGGDEFGLLLQHCPLPRAEGIADNIRKVVKDFRFVWEGQSFELGCSIGLVPIAANSVSPTELLSEADAACYVAKEKGRNRVQVFEPGDIELARRHGEMQWVSRINAALHEDRLLLYVQDIQPLTKGLPLHREILLRLLDENGKIVPPMSFIPAAERYNLMSDIDRWVIKNTFAWVHNESSEQGLDIVYNINLSGTSVSDPPLLLEFIEQQLTNYPISPQRICFEITETAAVQNLAQAAELISALKGRGFRFALDDFGSGLSSFMYLKTLPVDFLKIDGSFIRNIVNDPIDLAMVQAINTIGHIMGIKTIAEFVEDETTIAELHKLGIDFAQGFAIHRPEPLDQINVSALVS